MASGTHRAASQAPPDAVPDAVPAIKIDILFLFLTIKNKTIKDTKANTKNKTNKTEEHRREKGDESIRFPLQFE